VAFELEEETISSLREKLSSGKYTSEQLVQLYLDRIETIDKNGLELHSIIEVNSEAIAIAKTMDAEMKAGKSRGLYTHTVVIKDNIDTADKQTTAGSLAGRKFCFKDAL
jgi:amidase